jgi:hypothetical protein
MSFTPTLVCPNCKVKYFHDGAFAGKAVTCPRCASSIDVPADWQASIDRGGGPVKVRGKRFGLDYSLYGFCPLQAEGKMLGYEFYFRARHEHWTLAVSLQKDIEPAILSGQTEEPGFFSYDGYSGWHAEGSWADAGWMPFDVAIIIISQAAEQLERDLHPRDKGDRAG